ncbi:unnamed protein product [Brugia timori]|uniref:Uncharacterized protein n=1 Tax=Brugia timori TaxID=42155 RepID=A0A0R3QDP1_9BILA|nr:unnamed protein product [Brugia timori]
MREVPHVLSKMTATLWMVHFQFKELIVVKMFKLRNCSRWFLCLFFMATYCNGP